MSAKSDNDNRANQLNENNDAYWQSRDYNEHPEDWESCCLRPQSKSGERACAQLPRLLELQVGLRRLCRLQGRL